MGLQITTLAECLVTFGTGKWLLSCVDSFMAEFDKIFYHTGWISCHIWIKQMAPLLSESFHESWNYLAECLVTFRTDRWLLTWVGLFMGLQITTLAECLVTFWACEWLLSCVDPLMLFQITFLCKWLVIFGKSKWLLTCVDSFRVLLRLTHKMNHIGVKPFTCSKCDKSFTEKFYLKNHVFYKRWLFEKAWKTSHRREAICLLKMWQDF